MKYQILDNSKKTYFYSDHIPTLINQTMTINKVFSSESELKKLGYSNAGQTLEMLRQMGKLTDLNK